MEGSLLDEKCLWCALMISVIKLSTLQYSGKGIGNVPKDPLVYAHNLTVGLMYAKWLVRRPPLLSCCRL